MDYREGRGDHPLEEKASMTQSLISHTAVMVAEDKRLGKVNVNQADLSKEGMPNFTLSTQKEEEEKEEEEEARCLNCRCQKVNRAHQDTS